MIKELDEYKLKYTLLEDRLEVLRKALEEHFHRNFLVKRGYLIEIVYDGEDMDLRDEFLEEAIDICEKYLDKDELALVSIVHDYLGEIKKSQLILKQCINKIKNMTQEEFDVRNKNNEVYKNYNNKGNYNVNYIDDIEKYEDQLNMMGED